MAICAVTRMRPARRTLLPPEARPAPARSRSRSGRSVRQAGSRVSSIVTVTVTIMTKANTPG